MNRNKTSYCYYIVLTRHVLNEIRTFCNELIISVFPSFFLRSFSASLLAVLFASSFTPHVSQGQDLSLKIKAASFSLEEVTYNGYITTLTASYSLIKKEWWRYVKKIAVLENHKTHYIITFPADEKSENSGLSFVSVLEDNEEYASIKTALSNQKNNKAYKKYAYDLLLTFKVKFYTELIQKQINTSEKKAEKISREIDKYKKKIVSTESKKAKGSRIAFSKSILSYQIIQDSLNIELQKTQFRIENSKVRLKKIK